MITEIGMMKTEVVYNDTKTDRYRLAKIWDETKSVTSLLMIQAGSADTVVVDMTNLYCIRNLHALNMGGFDILNISSRIEERLNAKEIALDETNVEEILASINRTGQCLICWGKIGESNAKVAEVQRQLLNRLESVEDKLFTIVTDSGACWHPIAPQIRHEWQIERFTRPDYLKAKPEAKPEQADPSATSEATEPETDSTKKTKQQRKNTNRQPRAEKL